MADCDIVSSTLALKNTTIPVEVIEALQDLLVVTYYFGSKYFQGVLLDSSKRNAPCGINLPQNGATDSNEDMLQRAIYQRFTYFQNSTPPVTGGNNSRSGVVGNNENIGGKKRVPATASRSKQPNRMTIRLRPRQVLCSNCRSICNENSENVDKLRSSTRNKTVLGAFPATSATATAASTTTATTNATVTATTTTRRGVSAMTREENSFSSVDLSPIAGAMEDATEEELSGSARSREQRHVAIDKSPRSLLPRSYGKRCSATNAKEKPVTASNDSSTGDYTDIRVINTDSSSSNSSISSSISSSSSNSSISSSSISSSISSGSRNKRCGGASINGNGIIVPSLVPKVPRLTKSELSDVLNGEKLTEAKLNGDCNVSASAVRNKINSPDAGNIKAGGQLISIRSTVFSESGDKKNSDEHIGGGDKGMVLRKKHSIGSMEDLWDESVFEEKKRKSRTTPVLKISFGSEGRGTVLKIPSKVNNAASESDDNVNQTPEEQHQHKDIERKDVKKARKKARKLAKRKLLVSRSPSPDRWQSDSEDERKQNGAEQRYMIKRKKESGIGAQRTDAANDDGSAAMPSGSDANLGSKKLSISIKRLSENAYTTRMQNRNRNENGTTGDSSSSEEEQAVQEMDATDHSKLPGSTCTIVNPVHSERTCFTCTSGRVIKVGDIIWGKSEGCSWWPGKVVTFEMSANDDSLYACISWYGSPTSSLMNCDNLWPFLEKYKFCFNKYRKSGQYKNAIRQATYEAKQLERSEETAGTDGGESKHRK